MRVKEYESALEQHLDHQRLHFKDQYGLHTLPPRGSFTHARTHTCVKAYTRSSAASYHASTLANHSTTEKHWTMLAGDTNSYATQTLFAEASVTATRATNAISWRLWPLVNVASPFFCGSLAQVVPQMVQRLRALPYLCIDIGRDPQTVWHSHGV